MIAGSAHSRTRLRESKTGSRRASPSRHTPSAISVTPSRLSISIAIRNRDRNQFSSSITTARSSGVSAIRPQSGQWQNNPPWSSPKIWPLRSW
jgi:hypothetical protein